MSVSYNKIGHDIIKTIRDFLNDEFKYVSLDELNPPNEASEFISLIMLSSTQENRYIMAEERRFDILLRYYRAIDRDRITVQEQLRNRIDRIIQILNNNTTNTNWIYLSVDDIEYDTDEEEEDNKYVAEISISIINYNQWS